MSDRMFRCETCGWEGWITSHGRADDVVEHCPFCGFKFDEDNQQT